MNDERGFDRAVTRLMDRGSDSTPPEVIDAVLLAARSTPQERDYRTLWRNLTMRRATYALAAVAAVAVGLTTLNALGARIGSDPTPTEQPSTDLGIFQPIAGWIVYGTGYNGIWGVDPTASANRIQLTSESGTPLGWSSDGTRLLIMRGGPAEEHLLVLHADGSETQLTDRPMSIGAATFSADGSRVVFAAAESSDEDGADDVWAVYAVDADGGPATVLASQIDPFPAALTFSPDGTRIAYVLWGHGDAEHPVWVMDVDGTDAHVILANDVVMGGGHLRDRRGAVAWSPAGDRIALALEGIIYSFATDGSDFRRVTSGNTPLWSPDGSQLVTRSSATWHPGTHAARPLPTPVISDSPSISPESEAAFDVGLRYNVPTRIHARLPDGWVADQSGMRIDSDEAEASLAISFQEVDAVFTEPCNGDGRVDPPLMERLDYLAEAFTGWWHGDGPDPEREGYTPPPGQPSSTDPANTTVSGFRARYVEVRVPDDFDTDECVGGRYVTWKTVTGVERHHQPGDVIRIWIVEVGPAHSQAQLLVIDATSHGEPSPENLTELADVIGSLRIEEGQETR